MNQGSCRCSCHENPEEGRADPTWSIRVGFLEEGTAGTNFYQDWDELKTHMQCASQQERRETQAALKMGGGRGGCLSQGGWREWMDKLLYVER